MFGFQGDTQIRYFEVKDEPEENGKYVFFLSMFQAKEPQRSVCALPKRNVDYMKCEVMRFFKLGNNKGLIEPISMTVPRKVSYLLPLEIYSCVLLYCSLTCSKKTYSLPVPLESRLCLQRNGGQEQTRTHS